MYILLTAFGFNHSKLNHASHSGTGSVEILGSCMILCEAYASLWLTPEYCYAMTHEQPEPGLGTSSWWYDLRTESGKNASINAMMTNFCQVRSSNTVFVLWQAQREVVVGIQDAPLGIMIT